jgi:hypothetical protein
MKLITAKTVRICHAYTTVSMPVSFHLSIDKELQGRRLPGWNGPERMLLSCDAKKHTLETLQYEV